MSGGADSVCLLFLLREMRERLKLELRVLHVHHGIRPEADGDAAFVRALCEKLEIPFYQVNVDVPALAKREGISEEEAGRKARYEAFEAHAAAWLGEDKTLTPDSDGEAPGNASDSASDSAPDNAPDNTLNSAPGNAQVKIALAHHAGDRAETLLFHLFRGSGLKGLASIPPVRKTAAAGVTVIRPLLCLERAEIEEYLEENGITYCQDATNFEDAYARNRIRHHVLPYAEKEICSGAVQHLNQAAELLAEAEDYLKGQTDAARATCVETKQDAVPAREEQPDGKTQSRAYFVRVPEFASLPPILQKRLILELLLELSPGGKDVGATHVEMVRDLFSGESGREADLPFGILARREYDKVIIERNAGENGDGVEADVTELEEIIDMTMLSENEIIEVPWGQDIFTFQRLPYEKKEIIPEKTYTKWFDYDKIKNTLSIRTRRQGDFLMIRGGEGNPVRKTLKSYFITEKFPRKDREALPLLAEGSHVLWITGHRISEAYKVDEGTKTILQVERKTKWRIT